MTPKELRQAIDLLLRKAPIPASIATEKQAKEFKNLCKKAQTVTTAERMQSALNQLRSYYP